MAALAKSGGAERLQAANRLASSCAEQRILEHAPLSGGHQLLPAMYAMGLEFGGGSRLRHMTAYSAPQSQTNSSIATIMFPASQMSNPIPAPLLIGARQCAGAFNSC